MASGYNGRGLLSAVGLAAVLALAAWSTAIADPGNGRGNGHGRLDKAPLQTAAYWQDYADRLTNRGLLRTERAPSDARFTNADLVRHFQAIMLRREHAQRNGRFVRKHAPRRLKKLGASVRMHVSGRTVDATDRDHIADLLDRLGRVTGVRLTVTAEDPWIRLMILDRAERAELARRAAASPRWRFIARHVANDLDRAICSTYYSRSRRQKERTDYLIVIPAELSGIMRRSCIEEEMGQTFGPGADYAGARPSIFNDDEEFALLTDHDEYLLAILYDPRLEAGMTAEQAMPLVRRIVEDLRPGG